MEADNWIYKVDRNWSSYVYYLPWLCCCISWIALWLCCCISWIALRLCWCISLSFWCWLHRVLEMHRFRYAIAITYIFFIHFMVGTITSSGSKPCICKIEKSNELKSKLVFKRKICIGNTTILNLKKILFKLRSIHFPIFLKDSHYKCKHCECRLNFITFATPNIYLSVIKLMLPRP